MKKKLLFAMISIMTLGIFVGCSKNNPDKEVKENNPNKKTIYTTFFPVEDLTRRIVGDKMNIKTIIKGSEEPHSFELKSKDMAEIMKADLIIYNGAGIEAFIPDLQEKINDKEKFLDLSQGLTLLETGDALDGEKHGSINPHTWLSVKNAQEELDTIYKKVSSIDPQNENFYKKNLEKNVAEFKELDKKFETELAKVDKKDKYFVTAHAAFNYLAKDYGLKQIAVTGISPEDEPSAQQLKTIADFVKKHNISTIFFDGKATPKVAETLAKDTNTKTSTLYTMESLTEDEVKMGYIKIMEWNLKELIKSFND